MTNSLSLDQINQLKGGGRAIANAVAGDPALGPFALLPGTWVNVRTDADPPGPELPGRGWNMIALPFADAPGPPFRLLLSQYNERLVFSLIDGPVPNRGVGPVDPDTGDPDQHVMALDYEQAVVQLHGDDFPPSGLATAFEEDGQEKELAIHHEPGLFLYLADHVAPGEPNIARLATIPHGDAALGLGRSDDPFAVDGPPDVPTVNALPIGVDQDLVRNRDFWLGPYLNYHDEPPLPLGDPSSKKFRKLFDPIDPTALLKVANEGVDIVRTTKLEFDTTVASGGIHNIPFVVKQANASEMKATFWIQELAATEDAPARLRLQYVQVVQLDFFARFDGGPGRIKWPHVSINTMEKLSDVAPDRNLAQILP